MRILVIGSTSRTGLHLLDQGVQRGHALTAFTRRPERLGEGRALAGVVRGDGRDIDALARAMEGQDAVISIVANDHLGPSTMTCDVTRSVVRAMERAGARRLAVASSRALTVTRARIVGALVWTVFRHAYVDMVRAETVVEESALDWTLVRATMLHDGPGQGRVHTDFELDPTGGASRLARADFALALLDAVEDPSLVRRAIGVNGPDRRKALPRSAA